MSLLNEDFLQKALDHNYNQLFIAYSGGKDSTVLLYLARILPRVRAIHINHNSHDQSDDLQKFCLAYVQQLGLDCTIHQIEARVVKNREDYWRQQRYAFFYKILQQYPNSILCTAHHQQDQAESVLLSLLRGSSVRGLAGIYPVIKSKIGSSKIMRPFLNIASEIITEYAKKHHLPYIEDPSNKDLSLKRNYLRFRVMPYLQKMDQSAGRKLAESASLALEASVIIDQYLQQELRNILLPSNSLSLERLSTYSVMTTKWLLSLWFKQYFQITPTYKQLQVISQKILQPITSWQYQVSRDYFLYIQDGIIKLSYSSAKKVLPQLKPPTLPEITRWFLDSGYSIDSQLIGIRSRMSGDRCLPLYRQHSQCLKKIFQELKIDNLQRKASWVIYNIHTSQILGIYPFFVCK